MLNLYVFCYMLIVDATCVGWHASEQQQSMLLSAQTRM